MKKNLRVDINQAQKIKVVTLETKKNNVKPEWRIFCVVPTKKINPNTGEDVEVYDVSVGTTIIPMVRYSDMEYLTEEPKPVVKPADNIIFFPIGIQSPFTKNSPVKVSKPYSPFAQFDNTLAETRLLAKIKNVNYATKGLPPSVTINTPSSTKYKYTLVELELLSEFSVIENMQYPYYTNGVQIPEYHPSKGECRVFGNYIYKRTDSDYLFISNRTITTTSLNQYRRLNETTLTQNGSYSLDGTIWTLDDPSVLELPVTTLSVGDVISDNGMPCGNIGVFREAYPKSGRTHLDYYFYNYGLDFDNGYVVCLLSDDNKYAIVKPFKKDIIESETEGSSSATETIHYVTYAEVSVTEDWVVLIWDEIDKDVLVPV